MKDSKPIKIQSQLKVAEIVTGSPPWNLDRLKIEENTRLSILIHVFKIKFQTNDPVITLD